MKIQLSLTLILGLILLASSNAQSTHICKAWERGVQCFAYNPVPGCQCTAPGVCKYTMVDQCNDCANPKIYSVAPGKKCPVITTPTPTPTKPHVCKASERGVQCFAYNPVPGCQCTAPGKCKYTKVDRCNDCANPQIYSVAPGQKCPVVTTPAPTKPHVCKAYERGVQCFAYNPVPGCQCTAPGVCKYTKVDQCNDCANPRIYSVAPGQKCPVSTPAPFVPKKCPYIDPKVTLCAQYAVTGCACYKNGTCKTIQSNQCNACIQSNVYSFNENQACPKGYSLN